MRDPLFESVISGLKARKGQWSEIAKITGISTKTMQRMVKGDANSTRETLLVLAKHFDPPKIEPQPAGAP